jgi:hypothetical protein
LSGFEKARHWGGSSEWNVGNLSDTDRTGTPVYLNFVGNLYKRGKASSNVSSLYGSPVDGDTRVYALANIGPKRTSDTLSEWAITSLPSRCRSTSAVVAPSGITVRTASAAFSSVLSKAGSRPKERSATDVRVIADTQNGTGDIKDCISGCSRNVGGWPSLKVVKRSLTLPSNPFGDSNGNGYTNLEEWLQQYAAALEN